MPLKVRIINPDRVLFEGETEFLMVPSPRGMLGILPFHAPMFAALAEGEILMKDGSPLPVRSGMVKVLDDEVTILVTEQAEPEKDGGNPG